MEKAISTLCNDQRLDIDKIKIQPDTTTHTRMDGLASSVLFQKLHLGSDFNTIILCV